MDTRSLQHERPSPDATLEIVNCAAGRETLMHIRSKRFDRLMMIMRHLWETKHDEDR
jgi:hypothetical protein